MVPSYHHQEDFRFIFSKKKKPLYFNRHIWPSETNTLTLLHNNRKHLMTSVSEYDFIEYVKKTCLATTGAYSTTYRRWERHTKDTKSYKRTSKRLQRDAKWLQIMMCCSTRLLLNARNYLFAHHHFPCPNLLIVCCRVWFLNNIA